MSTKSPPRSRLPRPAHIADGLAAIDPTVVSVASTGSLR
jgi:hypothetical protein